MKKPSVGPDVYSAGTLPLSSIGVPVLQMGLRTEMLSGFCNRKSRHSQGLCGMSKMVPEVIRLTDILLKLQNQDPVDGGLAWISLWRNMAYILVFYLRFLKPSISLKLSVS